MSDFPVFVLRRYLAAHGLQERARVRFIDDFHVGAGVADGGHPATAEVTGRYRQSVFVVDAFISRSRPMALLRGAYAAGVAFASLADEQPGASRWSRRSTRCAMPGWCTAPRRWMAIGRWCGRGVRWRGCSGQQIVDFANKGAFDPIVLGAKGRSGIAVTLPVVVDRTSER